MVTLKDLHVQVKRINDLTGSPQNDYVKVGDKYVPQAGNYHLDGAYGNWKLCRMLASGGTKTIFGYTSKRELLALMQAYELGLEVRS